MRPEEFSSDRSGRLVKLSEGDWAFVPHPLPPEIRYTSELIRSLSEADRSLGELAGLSRTLPNPNLLVQPFIRREAVLSSRIEGTQSEIGDLYAYEAGGLTVPRHRPSPPEADVQEVYNYVRAMEYGMERLSTLPLSLRFIREIHEHLMAGVRGRHAMPGEFRTHQNWIGGPGSERKSSVYTPPPVPDLTNALGQLERYLYTDCDHPPLVRIGLIHYHFEALHPFLDGNGRTGRLLIALLLIHWDLLPLPLLYLSAFFERYRRDYYDLLLGVSKQGQWEDWVVFFLRGVAAQSRDASTRAKRLQELQSSWRVQLTQAGATGKLLMLADKLFEAPEISITQAQEWLGSSYPAAQRNVAKLVEARILEAEGETLRGKRYIAQDILNVLEESY